MANLLCQFVVLVLIIISEEVMTDVTSGIINQILPALIGQVGQANLPPTEKSKKDIALNTIISLLKEQSKVINDKQGQGKTFTNLEANEILKSLSNRIYTTLIEAGIELPKQNKISQEQLQMALNKSLIDLGIFLDVRSNLKGKDSYLISIALHKLEDFKEELNSNTLEIGDLKLNKNFKFEVRKIRSSIISRVKEAPVSVGYTIAFFDSPPIIIINSPAINQIVETEISKSRIPLVTKNEIELRERQTIFNEAGNALFFQHFPPDRINPNIRLKVGKSTYNLIHISEAVSDYIEMQNSKNFVDLYRSTVSSMNPGYLLTQQIMIHTIMEFVAQVKKENDPKLDSLKKNLVAAEKLGGEKVYTEQISIIEKVIKDNPELQDRFRKQAINNYTMILNPLIDWLEKSKESK